VTPSFEVVVVDNNSSDRTAELVAELQAADPRLRYVFEGRQGLSYARNSGIAAARGSLLAFTDDDVRVAPNWISAIARAFAENPDVDFVGGRVLPDWPFDPPEWLTPANWSPLALQEYPAPFRSHAGRQVCLVGASLAFRREVFDRVGLFAAEFQRVEDGIGSTEDHELLRRLWARGGQGVYAPEVTVTAEVQPERMTKAYHRRWYRGHGRFVARMERPMAADTPRRRAADATTLFSTPAYLYRALAAKSARWILSFRRLPHDRRFRTEGELLELANYVAENFRHHRDAARGRTGLREIGRFTVALVRKKLSRHHPGGHHAPPRRRSTDVGAGAPVLNL
jgi:GT2 family glycosyltransferase